MVGEGGLERGKVGWVVKESGMGDEGKWDEW